MCWDLESGDVGGAQGEAGEGGRQRSDPADLMGHTIPESP